MENELLLFSLFVIAAMVMFSINKFISEPYIYVSSSDEFNQLYIEMKTNLESANSIDDISILLAQNSLLANYALTHGDANQVKEVGALIRVKLTQIEIDLQKEI